MSISSVTLNSQLSTLNMLSLVTGASSGIGLQYATQLARDYHTDLLLVSNQQQELQQVAQDLAAQYASQPRLANALSNAKLEFREEEGRKVISFTVTNEAQKKWIEERILRDLEGKFARLADCGRIRLEPTVVPEEEQGKKIYLPSEKAEDLMSKNEEVRNLVVDLGLDIK